MTFIIKVDIALEVYIHVECAVLATWFYSLKLYMMHRFDVFLILRRCSIENETIII